MNTFSKVQTCERPPLDWPEPEALGFGQYLAPYAIVADHAACGWSAPRIVPLAEARSPVACGGLQYGLSAFEGLKAYRAPDGHAHLFRPVEHAERLRASAARLCMPQVDPGLFVEMCRLATQVQESWLPPHGRGSFYLRPTLYADEEALGFRTASRHRLVVLVTPSSDPVLKTVNLWAEPELTRAAPGGLGAAKTGGNYAAGLLGLLRAKEQGCDDVAWLDAATHTKLAEAGTMNLFVEIDRVWCTPPLDGTILAGVTRDSLMRLMRDEGLEVAERVLDLNELVRLERAGRVGGAIGTGTAARIVRIASITGPRTRLSLRDPGHAERFSRMLKSAQEGSVMALPQWRHAV
ncbi:MAG: aminotransferase class IV [Panacagrimonas sp.]